MSIHKTLWDFYKTKLKTMFNSNWNQNHEEFWKTPLELNDEGLSNFQAELLNKIKELLNSNSIKFIENTSQYYDLNNNDRIVKW